MARGFKSGGRARGTPNRATADVKTLAGEYTASAIETLVALMQHAESEQVRLGAARELLDRAAGRPAVYAEVRGALKSAPLDVRAMSDEELMAILQEGHAGRGRAEGADGRGH